MSENSEKNLCGSTETQSGDPCKRPAGWGTSHVGEGKCTDHPGRGAPEGNTNAEGNAGGDGAPEGNRYAEKHALFVETDKFYQEVASDDLRTLCMDIFEDYLSDYEERHGEPILGHAHRLFQISVNHIKIIYSNNWPIDKPAALDSGNPMVDKETEPVPTGEGTTTKVAYSETVVVGTQQKLRREDRQWLKDMGLFDGPDDQLAEGVQDLAEVWGGGLVEDT